jgi:hypothetical protein
MSGTFQFRILPVGIFQTSGRPRFSDDAVTVIGDLDVVTLRADQWQMVARTFGGFDRYVGSRNRGVSVWPSGDYRVHNYGGQIDCYTVNVLDDEGDVDHSFSLVSREWREFVAVVLSWELMEVAG